MKPFVIERVFDAPHEKVWQAWTEAEHLKHWWGPKGFVVTRLSIDLRPGGLMHYCLRTPDGKDMWGSWVIKEVARPKKLVCIVSFSDEKGGVTTHPMSPSWPREILSTVTFEAQGGKTRVTVQWVPLEGSMDFELKTFEAGRDSMKGGWTGTLDQFNAYLAGK